MLPDIAEVPRFGATALVLSEANDEGERGRIESRGRCGTPPARRGSGARSSREGKAFPQPKFQVPGRKIPNARIEKAPNVDLLLAALWVISQIRQQPLPILLRWRVLMHFPIFERGLRNPQLASQFLHRQILFQALGPHMISEASRGQMPVGAHPPTTRISPPIDQQPPLMKSQQTHPGAGCKVARELWWT